MQFLGRLTGIKRYFFFVSLFVLISGCAAPTPKKIITELYDPPYDPQYDYETVEKQSSPSGYTVGILAMAFDFEAVPAGSYNIKTDINKQYVNGFINAYSSALEQILMSKGVAVTGPYDTFEYMTYPERVRCDFLIQPIVKLIVESKATNQIELNGYYSPEGKGLYYSKADFTLKAKANMEYVLYDPMTKEKLQRHKVKVDPVVKSTNLLAVKYSNRNNKGEIVKEWYEPLWKTQNHPGAHNSEYVFGKVLDPLFSNYMRNIDRSISVEEFDHLKEYIKDLEEKKRF